jgi:hypothetical protein
MNWCELGAPISNQYPESRRLRLLAGVAVYVEAGSLLSNSATVNGQKLPVPSMLRATPVVNLWRFRLLPEILELAEILLSQASAESRREN